MNYDPILLVTSWKLMLFILFTKYYLLQAILARKLDVPELHSLMNKVEKEAITADNAHMRLQCRQVGTLSHTHTHTQACTHTQHTHIMRLQCRQVGTLSHTHTHTSMHTHNTAHTYICDYSVDRLVHFHTHTTHTYIYANTCRQVGTLSHTHTHTHTHA